MTEKVGGRPSNQVRKQQLAKAGRSMLPEILAELLLVRDISFNIHVEITDEIENKCYRIGRYLPQGVLNILTEMDRI